MVRWQWQALVLTGLLLLASGGIWLAVHHTIGAGAGELPHPAEVWAVRVHGLAAFASLFVLGALAAAHIPQGWRITHRRRRCGQRRTGTLLCVFGALLVLSGYALYYFAPEAVRPALGWAHAAAGAGMALLALVHGRGI
jgi:hypothetical protein